MAHGLAQASDELNVLLREKEVQERKSKSLMLLVTDIQRQVDDFYSSGPAEEDELALVGENRILRELLVKLAERAKEDQKMVSFLRQAAASGGKAQEYSIKYIDFCIAASIWRDRPNCSPNCALKSLHFPTLISNVRESGDNYKDRLPGCKERKASSASNPKE